MWLEIAAIIWFVCGVLLFCFGGNLHREHMGAYLMVVGSLLTIASKL